MFIATAKDGSEIRYRDGKRFLYLWSMFFPLVPAIAAALYFTQIGVWSTFIPLIYLYVFVPIVDAIIGEDGHNPPDEVISAMAADRFYSWMVRATVPFLWLSFIATAMLVGTQELPWWSIIALVVGVGSVSGNSLLVMSLDIKATNSIKSSPCGPTQLSVMLIFAWNIIMGIIC